jgi:hypothetical protein
MRWLAADLVAEVAAAESFQRACFLQGHPVLACQGQCLVEVLPGLAGRAGQGLHLAEVDPHLGVSRCVFDVAEELHCLPVALGRSLVVPGLCLQLAELIERQCLPVQPAEVAPPLVRLADAGGRSRAVAGQPLRGRELAEDVTVHDPVADVAVQVQGFPRAR